MSFKTYLFPHPKNSTHKNRYKDDEAIKETISEVFWYLLLLITVNIVAFFSRSVLVYYFSHTVERLFLSRTFTSSGGIDITYSDVVTVDDWWYFMENAFMDGLYSPSSNEVRMAKKKRAPQKYGHGNDTSQEIFGGKSDVKGACGNSSMDNIFSERGDASDIPMNMTDGDPNTRDTTNTTTFHKPLTNKTRAAGKKHAIDAGLVLLEESILLGPPRIRQLKVQNNSCGIFPAFKRYFQDCYGEYSLFNENRGDENEKDDPFFFTWGEITFYRSGGYRKYLDVDREANVEILRELRATQWIEQATRLIVVEFNLYNANANLFCFVKFLTELLPVGGVIPTYSIRCYQMVNVGSKQEVFICVTKVLFLLQLTLNAVKEGLQMYEFRRKYFKQFWSWVSLIVLVIGYSSLLYDLLRTYYMSNIIERYNKSPNKYLDMDVIALWQYFMATLIAICAFLVWIQIFKFISLNKTMLQFSMTLRKCSLDMFGFGLMFFLVFIAFAQMGYLLFGSSNRDFRTMPDAIFTMMRTILGDFEYLEIERANRILGPIFFLTYIFFVFFVLLRFSRPLFAEHSIAAINFQNMFLAIINDTYAEVKTLSTTDDIQLWNFLKRQFTKLGNCLCCAGRHPKRAKPPITEIPPDVSRPSDSDQDQLDPSKSSAVHMVVRRKDMLGRLFEEVKPASPPKREEKHVRTTSHSLRVTLDGFEDRLINLEMLMNNFVLRMNALINRLDSHAPDPRSRGM